MVSCIFTGKGFVMDVCAWKGNIYMLHIYMIFLKKAYIDDVDQGSRSPLAIIPLGIGPSSNDSAQQGEAARRRARVKATSSCW